MIDLSSLSRREREVFELIAIGKQPRDIAKALGIGVKTISTYRERCLQKLQVRSNAEIARLAMEREIAHLRDSALLARAFCAGVARWVPFGSGDGELVINGVRYFARMTAQGVPELQETLRSALTAAVKKAQLGLQRQIAPSAIANQGVV